MVAHSKTWPTSSRASAASAPSPIKCRQFTPLRRGPDIEQNRRTRPLAHAQHFALPGAVERYGQILDVSIDRGVPASLEFLGFVKGINTLERAWSICGSVGNPAGTITPDVWHMFRGGSNFATLDNIPAEHISCFHWNDAPREPEREKQTDADRVFPGDGLVDLPALAAKLRAKGFDGALSLELFNRTYWKQDPLATARAGLEKMRPSVGNP